MALIYNATFDSQTRVLSLLDKAGNVISSCEVPSKELVDDPNKPLMLRAIADYSSVTLKKVGTLSNTYQTSTDGTNWTDYTLGTQIILNKGESVYFRCSAYPTGQHNSYYVQFVMTGKIEAWHNVMSMHRTNDFATYKTVMRFAFISLFEDCTSLAKAPVLPATTLAELCYSSMFRGCTSLTEAPALPATTLARYCYQIMFGDCTSLTKAPALPATKLAPSCYDMMFTGCRSLTKAPALPATKLAEKCYSHMLSNCFNLNEVRISATTTAMDAMKEWLFHVSATGDFYCDPNAKIFPSGESGIPKGWRRLNINDYPVNP